MVVMSKVPPATSHVSSRAVDAMGESQALQHHQHPVNRHHVQPELFLKQSITDVIRGKGTVLRESLEGIISGSSEM